MKNGWTKYLARMAFKDKLPDDIVWRKDKMGWPQPIKHWLAGEFGLQSSKAIRQCGYLQEVLGEIPDESIELLKRTFPRLYFRLYNLSRFHEIFFVSQGNKIC